MRRSSSRLWIIGVAVALAVPLHSASADEDPDHAGPVLPDPAFLEPVDGAPCTPETPYEQALYGTEPRYGDACKRIRFAYGPIVVKPGQNEAVLEPVDIEQPRYDGSIVRFKPDLVRAADGGHPRTEDLHLHHATWLNLGSSYGDGPFFAAGEEKTIANFPQGYGMEVRANDLWGLLYMVHNATAQSEVVWLTYQIDFVAEADAEALGIRPVKPIWLDVQKHAIHPDAPSTSANPVFNAQRGFGHVDAETGTRVCRWPDENCARFDTYGNVGPQQGIDVSDEVAGTDWTVPADLEGTLIGLGGHLHPGGLRNEVSLVRGGVEKDIFVSDAVYWDFDDDFDPEEPTPAGSRPESWNLSMTVTGLPLDWAVRIRAGDVVRINAVYDTELASWYEGMGIVVALVAPDPHPGDEGVDVFDDPVALDRGAPDRGLQTPGPWVSFGEGRSFSPTTCTPDLDVADGAGRLCLRGSPTHGPIPESGHGGGCGANQDQACPALPELDGPVVTDIHSVGFTYGNADLGVIGTTGIPRLVKGQPARFWNYDTVAKVWHTYTRCREPCNGPTGVNYPLADGGNGRPDDEMDFDSSEIGYGLLYEPAKSQIGGTDPYDDQWVRDGAYWEFTPTETGTYTFWCRIHPGMRGAFKVIEPGSAAA